MSAVRTAIDRRALIGGSALVATGLLLGAAANPRTTPAGSGTVRLDGIDVYYEVHGEGLNGQSVPVVLLHGGGTTIETAFTPEMMARFASRSPVIAIEQQAHGHTADRPDRPITIEQMVKDTAGILSHLKVKQADLFGHSLGGMVATGLSIRHPDLVRSVATLGTPYQLEGFRADLVRVQRGLDNPSPELAALFPTEADFAAWRASFVRAAPDPTAYDASLARINAMLSAWPGWTEEELRSIRAPTLIAIGDNDYVRVDHARDVARLIPKARLAVLPGTTHLGIVKRDAWLEPMFRSLSEPDL